MLKAVTKPLNLLIFNVLYIIYYTIYKYECQDMSTNKKPAIKADFLRIMNNVGELPTLALPLPSALEDFTSEFEMGSGGALPV